MGQTASQKDKRAQSQSLNQQDKAGKFGEVRRQMRLFTAGQNDFTSSGGDKHLQLLGMFRNVGFRYLQKFPHKGNSYCFWNRHRHHNIATKLTKVFKTDESANLTTAFPNERVVWLTAITTIFGSTTQPSGFMEKSNAFSHHGWLAHRFNELFQIRFGTSMDLTQHQINIGFKGAGSFALKPTPTRTLSDFYLSTIDKMLPDHYAQHNDSMAQDVS